MNKISNPFSLENIAEATMFAMSLSPLPLLGEYAAGREALINLKIDSEHAIEKGNPFNSVNKLCRFSCDFLRDRVLGYLILAEPIFNYVQVNYDSFNL
jgi:hypothetical protein